MNVGELVELELKEYLDSNKPEARGFQAFLNNFYLHFPNAGGYSMYRDLLKKWGWEERFQARGKSGKEFYAELDAVVQECGIAMKDVENAIARYQHEEQSDAQREQHGLEMNRLLFQVYKKMREKGFAHDALTV